MKVLQVLHGFPPEMTGGTERAVEAWARALQDLGHDVAIAAGSIRPAPPAGIDRGGYRGLPVFRLHRDDLHYEDWWKAGRAEVGAAFDRLLDELQPQVVHVHHWLRLTWDLLRRARARGAATAVTLHDYWSVLATPVRRVGEDRPRPPAGREPLAEPVAAAAFARHRTELAQEVAAADLCLVPSAAHARGLQEMGLSGAAAFDVLPPPLLEPPPRRAATGRRRRRLLAWGTLYPDKGLDMVLEALRLVGPMEGLHLHVLGTAHDPDYDRLLRDKAKDLPVAFGGAFTPRDLAAVEADYALLPTLCHESYGLILDEALCLGLPVLCAGVPAYRERLPAGAGLTFPPGDAAALARLLADETALAALQPPPPPGLVDARQSAERLAEAYQRVLRRG